MGVGHSVYLTIELFTDNQVRKENSSQCLYKAVHNQYVLGVEYHLGIPIKETKMMTLLENYLARTKILLDFFSYENKCVISSS